MAVRSVLTILAAALVVPLTAVSAQSATQGDERAIVITGTREQPSNWRQAETQHVLVLSDGSESELTRITHNLERMHFLLSVLLNRVDGRDDALKLRVTLVGDAAQFDAMDLRNLRSAEGPYASAFAMRRYYDPREDGAVMAASRFDQRAILERGTPLAFILPDLIRSVNGPPTPGDPSTDMSGLSASFGGGSLSFPQYDPLALSVGETSVTLSAEERIYAGFAQHYLLTYFPNAYPRWYVDGFGELFSTIKVKQDGAIEYGRGPEGYVRVMREFGNYPTADVLTGRYTTDKRAQQKWTPFHAWALTHMLFFSEERRGQLHAYLGAIQRGASLEQAAGAFGDLATLQSELIRYDNGKMPYEQMTYPGGRAPEPSVRLLSKGEAAFVMGRLELGARTYIPPASSDPKLEKARLRTITERDRWLASLRADAARYPANLHAQLLLAEAECRSGNAERCIQAADRALATQPGRSDALAWKGAGQVQLSLASQRRAADLKAARATIARANRASPDNPLPLILYYRSFADAGETPPDIAVEGLMKVVDLVPSAPAPRVLLGEALAKRGMVDAARKALLPVANGAYETPEASDARRLLAGLGG